MKFSSALFIMTLVLSPFLLLAQGNFLPGLIVNKKGDTLKGSIDLKQWSTNPESITFREDGKPPAPNVTANDINYFEVTDKVAYKLFTTSVSLDETDVQHITDHRDTSSKTGQFFLKVEEQGNNVTLYSYTDGVKTRYYIYDSQTNKIAELIYRVYYVPNDKNNVSTVSQNLYKQQLLLIAQKFNTFNDETKSMLENANYFGVTLKRICRKINSIPTGSTASKLKPKNHFKFFVAAGASFSSTNTTGTFPFFNPTKAPSSLAPVISAGLILDPTPDVHKIYFRIEFGYTSSTYKSTGNLYFYAPEIKTTLNLVRNVFSITPQVQYNFYNTEQLKFYASGGVSLALASFTGNRVYNASINQYFEDYLSTNVSGYTLQLKGGTIINKHFEIWATYILPSSETDYKNGTTQEFDYNIHISTLQAGVGYIF